MIMSKSLLATTITLLLLSIAATQCAAAGTRGGRKLIRRNTEAGEIGEKDNEDKVMKKLEYRILGTNVSPNYTHGVCYSGDFYDKSGETKLGRFDDCITSMMNASADGVLVYQVKTTFTPDSDEETITTSCQVTVTPNDDDSTAPYNARERCSNLNGGILSPKGLDGDIKMSGKVNNEHSPTLDFDLLWTIYYHDEDPAPPPKVFI